MSILGLDAQRVTRLLRGVGWGGVDADADDAFARAAWTSVAEPGDGIAGLLVGSLGAAAALQVVIDRRPPGDVAAMLSSGDASAHGPLGGSPDACGLVAETSTVEASRSGGAGLKTITAALERWQPRLSSADVIRSLENAATIGALLILPGSCGWNDALTDLGPHAPHALWLRGSPDAAACEGASIALVGARAATGYGEHIAMESSAGLVDRRFTIVSGAAYGIDGMAHRAAIAGGGVTVAYLAGGVDRPYPSGHESLLERIRATGAVVSELPCGATPTKWRFLQRNRLIAAGSAATVVLEAGWRSGSINTAGHAATLGRPLGAVPGPVTSPASAGCHRLIRDYAATCVTNAEQMAELAGWSTVAAEEPDRAESPDTLRLRDAMSVGRARSVPDLAKRSGLSTRTVESILGMLALDGSACEREQGWVIVRA